MKSGQTSCINIIVVVSCCRRMVRDASERERGISTSVTSLSDIIFPQKIWMWSTSLQEILLLISLLISYRDHYFVRFAIIFSISRTNYCARADGITWVCCGNLSGACMYTSVLKTTWNQVGETWRLHARTYEYVRSHDIKFVKIERCTYICMSAYEHIIICFLLLIIL